MIIINSNVKLPHAYLTFTVCDYPVLFLLYSEKIYMSRKPNI